MLVGNNNSLLWYFLLISILNDLILTSIRVFFPAETTFIEVSILEYPIPGLIISTSDILLLLIIGLKAAPLPLPLESITFKSGIEKYCSPPNWRLTESILPLTIMGSNWAFLPVFMEIIGLFSKFNTEEPYPVPVS